MTTQRTAAWTKTASAEEIVTALDAGELDDLLGRNNPAPAQKPLTTDAEYAAALGLTVEEFGHIESPESQAKIQAKLVAEHRV